MKKITLIATTLFLSTASFAQTVTQKQMALMFKKTATWCNSCGTWGWTLFDEIWDARKNDAVIFQLHSSSTSQLYSSTAVTMLSYAPHIGSVPAFYVNMKNETQYSTSGGIYTAATKTRVLKVIDSTAAASPLANSGFTTNISKDTLYIKTKVNFFEDAVGEYYLGVYIAEENVIKDQTGIGSTAVHKQPLRISALANHMGNLIVNGNVSSGTEFTSSISYKIPSIMIPSNIRVFTVIWKKNGTTYEYVNAYRSASTMGINPMKNIQCDGLLYPSVASSQQSVQLHLNCLSNEVIKIDVVDQLGRNVNSIFDGKIFEGKNSFELNNGLKPGLYFVSLTGAGSLKTYRFIITD